MKSKVFSVSNALRYELKHWANKYKLSDKEACMTMIALLNTIELGDLLVKANSLYVEKLKEELR